MVVFSAVVSHQLPRKRVLRQWRAGLKRKEELCDADFLLVTAAKFHGQPAQTPCPVCESENLRVVLWIFGEHLGKMAGTARDLSEIERIALTHKPFTVHTVEVCPDCRWNHLLQTATAAA
ncbi:DUF5318 family protein [Corynebacterium hindlerae]|uniref:DUF5318 family protein n=1 Tax=Corynebacterium hindlerae TaxID=699041 RepID=A0A7G5FC12_9CORY|nr:DUF5318 family protein [Corynebacterium hindlerae]QMV84153.1 DUF5318 family protein [Corynebacterium hindlerae]